LPWNPSQETTQKEHVLLFPILSPESSLVHSGKGKPEFNSPWVWLILHY
jgi:hypothetical protein